MAGQAVPVSRELDIEIARLDGCPGDTSNQGNPWCPDGCKRHGANPHVRTLAYYSENLDALMALIRDRWPDGVVRLTSTCADIYRDLLAWHLATEEGGPKWCAQMQGDTDAERLAHAVRGALLAEVQP